MSPIKVEGPGINFEIGKFGGSLPIHGTPYTLAYEGDSTGTVVLLEGEKRAGLWTLKPGSSTTHEHKVYVPPIEKGRNGSWVKRELKLTRV